MRYGHVTGLKTPLSRIVHGTMLLTGAQREQGFALLDAAVDAGITAFDTAHIYMAGESERLIGEWLRSRPKSIAESVSIITKGGHYAAERMRITPEDIAADLHDSLERLGLERIELYILHYDDPTVPADEIIDFLNEHVRAGLIGLLGASNWTVRRIQDANAYAAQHGLHGFVASSPNYSLATQVARPWPHGVSISGGEAAADRRWYATERMPLLVWSSTAGGFFSGRFTKDNRQSLTSELDRLCLKAYGTDDNFERLRRAQVLGRERGLTATQIALAYVLSQEINVFAISGALTDDQMRANAAAAEIVLSEDELRWLNLETDSSFGRGGRAG